MFSGSVSRNGRRLHWIGMCILATMVAGLKEGHSWSLEEASAPYKGQSIRVICDGYSPCLAYQKMAKEFEQRTGIAVSVEVGDMQQVQQQLLTDALTGTQVYDGAQVNSLSIGVWGAHQFMIPLKKFLDDPKLHDPSLSIEDFVVENFKQTSEYKGEIVALPFSFIPPYAIYRRDIAGDQSERAAFKARYGYELPVTGDLYARVESWEQWRDMAQFFTRKAGDEVAGKTLERNLYGVSAAFKRHLTVLYDYERILLGMDGELLDADGDAKLDSPEALKALEFMLSLRAFSPPSYAEYTWDEQYSDFCAGNLFSTFTWGDTTPFLEDATGCPTVAGKLGYFVHPGSHKTVAEGQGWAIPSKSNHAEASFLFIQWLNSKEIQIKCMSMGCATPRKDVLMMKDWDASSVVVMNRQISENGWLYVRPNSPKIISIQEIMLDELSAAGAGQQDARTALEKINNRIKAIQQ